MKSVSLAKEKLEKIAISPINLIQSDRNKYQDPNKIQVGLIDSHPLTRTSIANLLTMNSSEFVVLPFSNTDEFLHHDSERVTRIELVLFNIGATGVCESPVNECVQKIIHTLPDVPLVVLSDRENMDEIAEAFYQGARGYIPMSLTPAVAIAALRLIHAGGMFVPPSALLEQITQSLAGKKTQELRRKACKDLTPRQLDVMRLLQMGKSNKAIAYDLGVQDSTVKVHVREIMKKLHATNRTQAVMLVSQVLGD